MIDRHAHEQNRLSWNAATARHNRHKGDQAAFLREGGTTLFPEEIELLGDIGGKRLVHLQCNSGQDTLSLAARGADVLGVDISDEAITFARGLSRDSGVPGRFARADLFDWFGTEGGFDVAFASYGALGWLSDLDAYFRGVAGCLAPGGRYVLVEFHPAQWIFDQHWRRTYPYSSHGRALMESGVNDYVAAAEGALGTVAAAEPFENPHATHEFAWGVADIVGGALRAGLTLERLEEWPWSNGCKLRDDMERLPGNRWGAPAGTPELPFMLGMVARR